MATRTARKPVAPEASVQVTDAVEVDATVTASKPTAFDRLYQVLDLIGRDTAKQITDADDVKWGKAIGLLGGGSIYINRSNADVRSSQKQVAEWSKAIVPSQVRGPQGQYLRITF